MSLLLTGQKFPGLKASGGKSLILRHPLGGESQLGKLPGQSRHGRLRHQVGCQHPGLCQGAGGPLRATHAGPRGREAERVPAAGAGSPALRAASGQHVHHWQRAAPGYRLAAAGPAGNASLHAPSMAPEPGAGGATLPATGLLLPAPAQGGGSAFPRWRPSVDRGLHVSGGGLEGLGPRPAAALYFGAGLFVLCRPGRSQG
ncbi:uncharacterized protein LOC103103504 [Monodelphis domestica]|uniref:uncharacterized protein LOC103103504 n=1 Tax=Monodelphis domestica TaxID=13616 RepID=UPI0024E1DB75|nr:uncharacterized protein LOC103103504 [Monodelphis domestica]